MIPDEQNSPASKPDVDEHGADSRQRRERLGFAMAMALLWSLGLWFFLTH